MIISFKELGQGGGSGSGYTLPVATSQVLGGVKIGSGVNVASDGTISVDADTEIFKPVEELPQQPAAADVNKIFLVPASTSGASNAFDEYIWVDNDWELVGQANFDLSNYYTSAQTESAISTAMASETARTENTYLKSIPAEYWTSGQTSAYVTGVTSPIQAQVDDIERVTATAYTELHTDIVAISGATSAFTTSGDVASQINTAMASETARTESTYLKEHQTLPTATTSQYGMVKIGSGITVDDGVISVTSSTPTGETIVNKVYPLPNQEGYIGPVGTMYPRIEVDGVWGVELDQYNNAEFRLSNTDDGSEREILNFYAYTNTAGTGDLTHQRAVSTDTDSVPRLMILDDNDTTLYEFTGMTPSEYVVNANMGNGELLHIKHTYENWQDVYRVWTEKQNGEKIENYDINYDFIKPGDGIIQYVGKDSYGNLLYEKVGATLYARADFPKFAKSGDVIMYNTKIGYWEPELIQHEYTRVFYFTGDADSNPYGVNEFTIAEYYIDDEYNPGYVKLIWDTDEETWYYHADGCEGKPYADDRDEDGPYDITYYDGSNDMYSKMTIDSMPNWCDYNDCDAPYIMTLGAGYDNDTDEEFLIAPDVVCSNPDSISTFMQYDGTNWNKVGNDIDLSNYYTSAQTNAAITAATQNFVTSGDVNSQITAATQNFVTSGDVNNQITAATADMATTGDIQNFVTSGDVNSQITAATTNFVTSGDVNNQITSATQNFVTSGDVATQISGATSNMVTSTTITTIVKCTENEWSTISGSTDNNTLYIVV